MAQEGEDDLDLLLSLSQDRVLETPPSSPTTLWHDSDNGSPRRKEKVDMSVFRSVVEDCLDYTPETAKDLVKCSKPTKCSKDPEVEKFSGLRIRNQLVSSMELSNRFSEIRFVRLQAIKNVLIGDTLSGCWATVGVLAETGITRTSSNGKNFCIWKIGCLDENTISVFLFGDAFTKYSTEKTGAIFALFNCGVRKDNMGTGFSLSVFSAGQILKIGTSIDYGVCKGKRQDGMACTMAINKKRGTYCKYHKSKASEKYSVTRNELKGGNLRTAFRDFRQPEGVYMVDPMSDIANTKKSTKPLKLLSVDCLKKALSNAGKVTTNIHSQGIRFLNEVTAKLGPKPTDKPKVLPDHQNTKKRIPSEANVDMPAHRSQELNAKRRKVEPKRTSPEKTEVREKMIELDFVSSDEDL